MRGLRLALLLFAATTLPFPASCADATIGHQGERVFSRSGQAATEQPEIVGRASVIDGATLWFARSGQAVRLAGIDTCALPQWSFDPELPDATDIPRPLPCGALAKAWLKRAIGEAVIACRFVLFASPTMKQARCRREGRDLAVEMLRVGMARVASGSTVPPHYVRWQDHARSARHGIWGTFVLDMDEWRAKAVDRTLARMPIADFNLLAERQSEISPPFEDARRRPLRTDR